MIAGRAWYEPSQGNFSRQVPAVIELKSHDGQTIEQSTQVTLTANGAFLIPLSAAPDYYDISLKGDRWLRKRIDNVPVDLYGVAGLLFEVVVGDMDGDNEIGIGDFSLLSSSYGSSLGEPNWVETADLNMDDSIDIADYAILSQNYGRVGDD